MFVLTPVTVQNESNTIFQANDWNNYIAKGLGVLAYCIIVWISLILGFSVIGQWD